MFRGLRGVAATIHKVSSHENAGYRSEVPAKLFGIFSNPLLLSEVPLLCSECVASEEAVSIEKIDTGRSFSDPHSFHGLGRAKHL